MLAAYLPSVHDCALPARAGSDRVHRRRDVLGGRRPPPRPLLGRGSVHPGDHRPRRGQLRLHRGRPEDPRLHVRPDELDPRPLASGHRGHGATPDRDARPPVQRNGQPPGCRPGPPPGRNPARAAGEGAAADDRRRVERGGDPDGQAGHRQARDRLVRPVVARHDPGRRERHVQRRAQGIRPGGRRATSRSRRRTTTAPTSFRPTAGSTGSASSTSASI